MIDSLLLQQLEVVLDLLVIYRGTLEEFGH
jgi:hypothetical protein